MVYDDSKWVQNSIQFDVSGNNIVAILIVIIALAIFVIAHSMNLHDTKYGKLRICTEIAAVTTLIQAVCYFQCADTCSLRRSAYLLNVVSNGICGTINQICDNYIVYNRFLVIYGCKDQKYHKIVIAYVVIFLYLTWVPLYTIVPFFIDLNTHESKRNIMILTNFILLPTYIFYDLYFTYFMVQKLITLSARTNEERLQKLLLSLSRRTIYHNILSILGIISYCFWFPYGVVLFNVCTTISLHFLFNMMPLYNHSPTAVQHLSSPASNPHLVQILP